MGLENWIDGLEKEDSDSDETCNPESEEYGDFEYTGDKEVGKTSIKDVESLLEDTSFDFSESNIAGCGECLATNSENESFMMAVVPEGDGDSIGCVSVRVIESKNLYDVIDPKPIFIVDEWSSKLKNVVKDIKERQDEIVKCPLCGGTMIIRKTNNSGEWIRGCSNHPKCRNKDHSYSRDN